MTVRRERDQVDSVEQEADAARRRAELLSTPGVIIHRRDPDDRTWTFVTDLEVNPGVDISKLIDLEGEYNCDSKP